MPTPTPASAGPATSDLAALPDVELAVELARRAGEVLLGLRRDVDAAGGSFTAGALKDAGDAAAQAWLARALAAARPDDAVLSEEAQDDPARVAAGRVWIIDPLDGTREFAERHADGSWRDDFAVHVALWESRAGTPAPPEPGTGRLAAGAVALPARGRVYSSDAAAPERGEAAAGPFRLAASRSRPPAFVAEMAARGDVKLVPMGSAGVKVMAVVDGTVDAYAHGGGQYEWDSAAPVAVALAHGLVCVRLDGSPLVYNRTNPWLPDLLVCRPDREAHLRAMLDSVGVPAARGLAGDRQPT